MKILTLLKTRIILVSALSIIFIALTLIFSGALIQDEAESRYQIEAFNGKRLLWNKIVEGQLDVMRAELFSFTRNIKAMSSLAENDNEAVASSLQPTFNRLKASKIIDGMYVYATNGYALFKSSGAEANITFQGVVSRSLESGKITTGIEIDKQNQLNLVFALPLYKKPGMATGVGVFTRSLQSLLTEFKRSDGSDFYIVSDSNELVFSTNKELFRGIKSLLPNLGEKRFSEESFGDQLYAVLAQPVIGANGDPITHLVSIAENTKSFTKQADIKLYSNTLAVIIFVLILLFLNWYIRGALKPLDEVQSILKSVAEGDLTTTIEVKTNDEVGQMLS